MTDFSLQTVAFSEDVEKYAAHKVNLINMASWGRGTFSKALNAADLRDTFTDIAEAITKKVIDVAWYCV